MRTKIALRPDEQVVMSSDKNILTLTTKRVRYDCAVFGASGFMSITLDSVASCGVVTKSFPILLLAAAAALISAFIYDDVWWMFFGVAAVFVVVYCLTRRAVISIASNGGETIMVPARRMSRHSIIEFLEAVEAENLR